MIWDNILRRLNAIKLIIQNTNKENGQLNTIEKSSYYRSIIIIFYTVIEGLVYELVKKETTAPDHVFEKTEVFKSICTIKSSTFGIPKGVKLYRKEKKDLKIDDNGATFGKLNLFLKNRKIISPKEYSLIEWARTERNKLHVQGLTKPDIGYTFKKVKKASKVAEILVKKFM
jgi:hypothetical protein